MLQPSFEELKTSGELPTPTGVGMQILRMTQGEEFSTEEVGQVISTDPALAGRLLKLANSAESGSAEPITTVGEAMMRLGIRAVRNLALGLSLISGHRIGACAAFDYDGFWGRSLARAVAAKKLSAALRFGVPAETYILGLLSDVGSLALASVHADAYSKLLRDASIQSAAEYAQAEQERFGIDHSTVSGLMLGEWGLPEDFARAARGYQAVELTSTSVGLAEMSALLRAADVIASLLAADETLSIEAWETVLAEFQRLERISGLDRETFRTLCNEISSAWIEWGRLLEIPAENAMDFHQLEVEVRKAMSRAPRSCTRGALQDELSEAAEQGEGALGPLRVLAVDDEPVSLKVLERHLLNQGFQVRTAQDGAAARELAEAWEPHLVIADWHMPGMSGVDLCKAMRERPWGRDMHFLLLTGNDERMVDEDNIVRAFEEAQVDDYVTKPFRPKILMARIKAGCRAITERLEKERKSKKLAETNAELIAAKRKAVQMSYTDLLTGLGNRRLAMRRLAEAWSDSGRRGVALSLIMADIDNFKRINDEHGHDAGDAALKEVARRFEEATREEEIVCRIGGEEFLIICANTPLGDAVKVAERLRKSVASSLIQFPEGTQQVTLSLGVATRVSRMDSYEALLKAADVAVYAAKEGGRNKVVWEIEGDNGVRYSA